MRMVLTQKTNMGIQARKKSVAALPERNIPKEMMPVSKMTNV